MNRSIFTLPSLVLGLAGLYLAAGCGPAPAPGPAQGTEEHHHDHHHDHDHDHHHGHDHHAEVPETFGAAVEKVDSLRAAIKEAFEAEDMDKADGPVHAVGDILEAVPGLAEKAGLSEEDRTAVQEAVQTLFTHFGAIDEKIHGGEGKNYADVADEVEAAVETLKQAAASDPNEAPED